MDISKRDETAINKLLSESINAGNIFGGQPGGFTDNMHKIKILQNLHKKFDFVINYFVAKQNYIPKKIGNQQKIYQKISRYNRLLVLS